jgi:transposase
VADEPSDHALGRSKGGFGTKLHVLCDASGWLLAVVLTAGQVHETQAFETLLESVSIKSIRGPAKRRAKKLAGDKGYSSNGVRDWLKQRHIESVIPYRSNEQGAALEFDTTTYRRRNMIERSIGWLKECRRIATRYEKLAKHFLSMIHVAMILQFLTFE